MEKRILIATLLLCSILLLVGMLPVHGEEKIYDTAVRLHVLANSDSEEDQALKLLVRDAILAETVPLLQGCNDRGEACRRLEAHFPQLQLAAERVIAEQGRSDSVSILLGEETYPERSYDSVCFPAGTYVSLRVCIGEAQGQNWWCCLFPPLCLGTATVSEDSAEDAFISVGMTPSQYKIITETEKPVYKVRFKLLEILQQLGF